MKKIFTIKFLLIFIVILFSAACSNPKLNEDNIVQIGDLGIRKGVFERKFKMTNVYNDNEDFTPESLKSSLDKILLPDHLLIYEAYNLSFDKDPKVVMTMLEHNMNLLAANHPIHTENISIPKEDMEKFYEKKKILYDFEIIQHNSFYWADSIYRYMQAGNEIEMPDTKTNQVNYPRKIYFENSTYGNDVPVEVYDVILEMNENMISKPIYSGPVWTIVKLIKKKENKKLQEYDKMVSVIADQLQPVIKNEQIKKMTDDLTLKYNVQIENENLEKIYKCFNSKDGEGRFDRSKLSTSDLNDIVISTSNEDFNIDFLVFMLNRSQIFNKVDILTQKELEIVVKNISDMIVFYFDTLENEIDKIEIIQDKIQNKENRLLFTKYLNEEIIKKVVVTEEDAEKYWRDNRAKWPGEFENVKSSVIGQLRKELMYQRRDNLLEEFREDFTIQYNESALKELSDKFTEEKKTNKNKLPISKKI